MPDVCPRLTSGQVHANPLDYQLDRFASVAWYEAVSWQVGIDGIRGDVLYKQGCFQSYLNTPKG